MFRATLHEGQVERVIYKVGAPERVIEHSSDMLDPHGIRIPLDREALHHVVADMGARGLRVLALARRQVEAHQSKLELRHVADGMTLLGLEGMIDPPRDEAMAAVSCRV